MLIKICGMRDSANMREILCLKPDYMGFIFHRPSPRYVGDDFEITLGRDEFASCRRVGVFVDASWDAIAAAARKCSLDVIQLHGGESPEFCRALRKHLPGMTLWKAFQVDANFDFSLVVNYVGAADAALFDAASAAGGGSGRAFDWSLLSRYGGSLPLVMAGGIGPQEAQAVARLCESGVAIHAVDLNSRIETSPGVKSKELAAAAIRGLRS